MDIPTGFHVTSHACHQAILMENNVYFEDAAADWPNEYVIQFGSMVR